MNTTTGENTNMLNYFKNITRPEFIIDIDSWLNRIQSTKGHIINRYYLSSLSHALKNILPPITHNNVLHQELLLLHYFVKHFKKSKN